MDYRKFRAKELSRYLIDMGLSGQGTKEQLIARIEGRAEPKKNEGLARGAYGKRALKWKTGHFLNKKKHWKTDHYLYRNFVHPTFPTGERRYVNKDIRGGGDEHAMTEEHNLLHHGNF